MCGLVDVCIKGPTYIGRDGLYSTWTSHDGFVQHMDWFCTAHKTCHDGFVQHMDCFCTAHGLVLYSTLTCHDGFVQHMD